MHHFGVILHLSREHLKLSQLPCRISLSPGQVLKTPCLPSMREPLRFPQASYLEGETDCLLGLQAYRNFIHELFQPYRK